MRMDNWYEMPVTPMPQVPQVCEAVEAQGWEIVGTFNTGMLASVGSILDPKQGMRPNAVPLIGIICRKQKINGNEARPKLQRPGENA